MTEETIALRRFTPEDQMAFAESTGDRNPMHLDPEAARRTQAGVCAVHGVHGLLWALEQLALAGAPLGKMVALKADFGRFIAVGAEVTLVEVTRAPDRLKAELRIGSQRATTLELRFGASLAGSSLAGPGPGELPPPEATSLSLEDMEGIAGRLRVPGPRLALLFPALAARIGEDRLAAIGLASTLVGMVVPGLHSIFSGLNLRFSAKSGMPGLGYAVRRADPRFRLVTLDLDGPGLAGTATAFVRYPPVQPPRLADLADAVAPGEFAGRHALVIGGSRGIGAATALLLGAGGARVSLTYRHARGDAEALRRQIGPKACSIAPYDVMREPAAQLAPFGGDFTHVYYFATGKIGAGEPGFDPAAFDAYAQVYLAGFARLAAHLGAAAQRPVQVLWPSTVYVEARPKGLGDYAMVKAAGEVLCAELSRVWPRLRIEAPRLPRILTDQTATVPPVPAEDPVAVMLPLLRSVGGEASGPGQLERQTAEN